MNKQRGSFNTNEGAVRLVNRLRNWIWHGRSMSMEEEQCKEPETVACVGLRLTVRGRT